MSTPGEIAVTEAGETSELLQYFTGQMPPVRLPTSYLLGLFLVAVAMMLLLLMYPAFIGLLGWAMYFWATHGVDWFFPKIGGTRRFIWELAVIYAVPLLAGLILVLFMLKSFFSPWRFRQFATSISHLDHPEIFHFLGQLCQQIGAPIPSRVDVSLELNAGAGFREGFASFFGNDIMLTFGLPLVAGLNCREFAGIIAHELGHFTQRAAMRCNFIIRSVNGWLFRAVYARDEFDDWTEDASNASAITLIVFGFARLAIGLTRGLMFLLLMLGHTISSYMSRQMEFHADACEIAVAGTEGFLATSQKMLILQACADQAGMMLKNRVAPKYPDDLSTYIAMLASQSAAQMKGRVLKAATKAKTRWFFSHPSYAARNERARQANEPGIIHDTRPATVLFNNFPELSRGLTLAHYLLRNRGQPIPADRLFSVEAPKETAPDTAVEEAAIKQYFCGLGLFLKPILIEPGTRLSVGLASGKLEQLKHARQQLQSADLLTFRESVKALDSELLQALQASALSEVGLTLSSESAATGEPEQVAAIGGIREQQEQLEKTLEPFETAAKLRLMTALSLLRTPAVATAIPNTQQLQDEVQGLLHVFGKLSVAFPSLLELRREFAVLQTFLSVRSPVPSEPLDAALADSCQRSSRLLAHIHEALGSTGYPFQHPRGPISIVDYARGKQFDTDPLVMMHKEAESHLQMLFALYHQVLGRLAAIALQVEEQLEKSAGMPWPA